METQRLIPGRISRLRTDRGAIVYNDIEYSFIPASVRGVSFEELTVGQHVWFVAALTTRRGPRASRVLVRHDGL